MLSPSIPDVLPAAAVEQMDRSELIAHIRWLETQRSSWEFRVRVCEEKEQLWKNLLQDMGMVLAATFNNCHVAISQQAEEAAKIAEQMAVIGRKVEDM